MKRLVVVSLLALTLIVASAIPSFAGSVSADQYCSANDNSVLLANPGFPGEPAVIPFSLGNHGGCVSTLNKLGVQSPSYVYSFEQLAPALTYAAYSANCRVLETQIMAMPANNPDRLQALKDLGRQTNTGDWVWNQGTCIYKLQGYHTGTLTEGG